MADWGKLGAIGSIVGGLAAIVALGPQFMKAPAPVAPTTSSPSATAPSVPGTTQGDGGSDHPTRTTPKVGTCIDASGGPVACSSERGRLVVAANPCTVDAAAMGLGLDTSRRQFDLAAALVSDVCTLTPGAIATASGASAEDIRRIAAGENLARLSLCYATQNGPEVACSDAHVIEYVGPWASYDGHSTANTLCDASARRYTNRTFDAPTEELKLVLLTGNGQYRCAVSTQTPLTKSVWQIGGAPLR